VDWREEDAWLDLASDWDDAGRSVRKSRQVTAELKAVYSFEALGSCVRNPAD